ncbi:MAG: PEGA domain-containing protein [Myxococcales bacterium]|nr:PEGA domain-containing protein [Myxococcales bacterium]
MRNRLWGGLILGVGLLVSACPKQLPAPDESVPDAGASMAPPVAPKQKPPSGPGLVLLVQPADAELIIDGTSYGPVAHLETENGKLPLKPGIYQVALKRAGYTSWRAEVTVTENPEALEVSLVRQ